MVSERSGRAYLRHAAMVLASCFFFCNATTADVACPARIEVQEHLVDLPENWNSIVFPNAKRDLSGVEFRQRGDIGRLNYDGEDARNGLTIYSYWFPDKNATYQVVCTYANTHVELIKDLPRNTRKCDVTFTTTQSGTLVFKKAECS